VPRVRTTKALAQRIDLNYFKRPIPMRRARFWLCLLIPLAGLVWVGSRLAASDYRPYSSGPLSKGHVLLTRDCVTCHAPEKGAFFQRTSDKACVACHDGPIHQTGQKFEPNCGTCHVEHKGGVRLIATSNESCAQCHANLQTKTGSTTFAHTINSLNTDHPEMAVFRDRRKDPVTIRVNHFVHMKKNLLGPRGAVQLECADCHRAPVAKAPWRYGTTEAEAVSSGAAAAAPAQVLKADLYAPDPSRALMTLPKFTESCSSCHLLQFDKRIPEQAPHDKPEVVRAFVVKKLEAYIAAHPAELHEGGEEDRRLPSRPAPVAAHTVTPAQWVAERTKEAESLLWGKTCKQCHQITITEGQPLPKVAASNYTLHWLPRARFDHDAHRGFACASCHPKAITSQDSAEVLLPQLATCQTCHAPGPNHAESRCFECHAYHDWTKRKEINPTFVPSILHATLPQSANPPGQ
jgi:hypothetical protein